MITFIMLTKLTSDALSSPHSLESLERAAMQHVQRECPELEWLANYAVLGPFDYLNIFRAPSLETAIKTSALIRSFGHAHTQVWPATSWNEVKDMIRHLPSPSGLAAE